MEEAQNGFLVPVLYCRPEDAKGVKSLLADKKLISKSHRMVKFDSRNRSNNFFFHGLKKGDALNKTLFHERCADNKSKIEGCEMDFPKSTLIAIPLCESIFSDNFDRLNSLLMHEVADHTSEEEVGRPAVDKALFDRNPNHAECTRSKNSSNSFNYNLSNRVMGCGEFECPKSTASMGKAGTANQSGITTECQNLSFLQQCIWDVIVSMPNNETQSPQWRHSLMKEILNLPKEVCPVVEAYSMEKLGSDTVLLPQGALDARLSQSKYDTHYLRTSTALNELLDKYIDESDDTHEKACSLQVNKNISQCSAKLDAFQHLLFEMIVRRCGNGVRRLARKCGIEPESPIRESRCALLYHAEHPSLGEDELAHMCCQSEGPESLGWITIVEHGIRQSFDFTKVMFSRGNVTEKLRFGKHCVLPNEVILDMYSGIGYYTLPALILGHASMVYACEWNPQALVALKFNLRSQGIDFTELAARKIVDQKFGNSSYCIDFQKKRSTKRAAIILEGDARETCELFQIIDCVDRVSLGLLPSSEGGWNTAIRALRNQTGGWLHVHGNVPVEERQKWTVWLCHRLLALVRDRDINSNWSVVCTNVVKVKSFAPRIDHVVADVFVGPIHHWQANFQSTVLATQNETFQVSCVYTLEEGKIIRHDAPPDAPSCCFSPHGAIHQSWLMD